MGFLDRFKKEKQAEKSVAKKEDKKEPSMAELYGSKKDTKAPEKEVKPNKSPGKKKMQIKDSGDAYKVLIKPLISEKATFLGQYNQYIFEINSRANKVQVKNAIKSLYNVDPVSVRIINKKGRGVTFGRVEGVTKSRKKAVVTLRQGESIQVYEGV